MIKKLLLLPILTLLIASANIVPAYAEEVFQQACTGANASSTLCTEAGKGHTLQDNGLFGTNGILNRAANFLLVIVGIVGVFMVIIGGVQYALSGGDPQKINKAKDMIIYAIVGLIVAAVAKGVIAFVINRVA